MAIYFKKEVYGFGSSIIRKFITTRGEYADLGDIKLDEFVAALAGKYPDEDKAIIKVICDWLIYYE